MTSTDPAPTNATLQVTGRVRLIRTEYIWLRCGCGCGARARVVIRRGSRAEVDAIIAAVATQRIH